MTYRVLMIFLTILLSGCASVSPLSEGLTEYNIAYGEYENWQLDGWKPEETVCVEIYPLKANNGDKWSPRVGINYYAEDEEVYFDVALVGPYKGAKRLKVISKVVNKGKEEYILFEKIKYKENIKLEVGIYGDYVVVNNGKKSVRFPISFSPVRVEYGISSIQASARYTRGACA